MQLVATGAATQPLLPQETAHGRYRLAQSRWRPMLRLRSGCLRASVGTKALEA